MEIKNLLTIRIDGKATLEQIQKKTSTAAWCHQHQVSRRRLYHILRQEKKYKITAYELYKIIILLHKDGLLVQKENENTKPELKNTALVDFMFYQDYSARRIAKLFEISEAHFSRILSGKRTLTEKRAEMISEKTGIPVIKLFKCQVNDDNPSSK